eukprot:1385069-Rhodomonas_salina.1
MITCPGQLWRPWQSGVAGAAETSLRLRVQRFQALRSWAGVSVLKPELTSVQVPAKSPPSRAKLDDFRPALHFCEYHFFPAARHCCRA